MRFARTAKIACLTMALLGPLCGGACQKAAQPGPEVVINGHTWAVEVAMSDSQRQKGLSGRAVLPDDRGMLFVFPDSRVREFWMHGCLISLDIAYIDSQGTIVSTSTMYKEPGVPDARLKIYSSVKPAQYALELPAGALDRSGVKEGDHVTFRNIPDPAKADPSSRR